MASWVRVTNPVNVGDTITIAWSGEKARRLRVEWPCGVATYAISGPGSMKLTVPCLGEAPVIILSGQYTLARTTISVVAEEVIVVPPPPPPPTPPSVIATSPASGATGQAIGINVTASFDQDMLASSLNTNTFLLRQGVGGALVPGAVSYDVPSRTATFNPTSNLLNSQLYEAQVTTGAQNSASLAMAANYTWTFTSTAGAVAQIVNPARLGLASLSAPVIPAPTAPGTDYFIVDRTVLLSRSTSIASYTAMKAVADAALGTPNLSDQDSLVPAKALAAALVYARTGTVSYKTKVDAALAQVSTYNLPTASALTVGRQIAGYCLAADLVGYRPAAFVAFMDDIRTKILPDHPRWVSIEFTSGDSASNWGAWCLPSRIAASLYVGDTADVATCYSIFRGFLGDRTAYSGFEPTGAYDPSWDCDPYPASSIVGINRNCSVGKNGIMIEDISRSAGAYPTWDSSGRNYSWEALMGVILSARLLQHNGYPSVWTLSSNAIRRAAEWLHAQGGGYPPPFSVTQHVPWEINKQYGLSLGPVATSAGYGRSYGFSDWLHGS